MSKAIKELERQKREEERLKLMQKFYEMPTPPYAPPLIPPMKKGSSSSNERLMAREHSREDAEGDKRTFENAGWKCRVVEEISRDTRHPTGIWEVWCTTSGSSNPISIEDVKGDITKMIEDERMAAEDYSAIAKALDQLGFRGSASGVILIANDERTHRQTLENILRGIS